MNAASKMGPTFVRTSIAYCVSLAVMGDKLVGCSNVPVCVAYCGKRRGTNRSAPRPILFDTRHYIVAIAGRSKSALVTERCWCSRRTAGATP